MLYNQNGKWTNQKEILAAQNTKLDNNILEELEDSGEDQEDTTIVDTQRKSVVRISEALDEVVDDDRGSDSDIEEEEDNESCEDTIAATEITTVKSEEMLTETDMGFDDKELNQFIEGKFSSADMLSDQAENFENNQTNNNNNNNQTTNLNHRRLTPILKNSQKQTSQDSNTSLGTAYSAVSVNSSNGNKRVSIGSKITVIPDLEDQHAQNDQKNPYQIPKYNPDDEQNLRTHSQNSNSNNNNNTGLMGYNNQTLETATSLETQDANLFLSKHGVYIDDEINENAEIKAENDGSQPHEIDNRLFYRDSQFCT